MRCHDVVSHLFDERSSACEPSLSHQVSGPVDVERSRARSRLTADDDPVDAGVDESLRADRLAQRVARWARLTPTWHRNTHRAIACWARLPEQTWAVVSSEEQVEPLEQRLAREEPNGSRHFEQLRDSLVGSLLVLDGGAEPDVRWWTAVEPVAQPLPERG